MKTKEKIELMNPEYLYIPYSKSLRKEINTYIFKDEIIALNSDNSIVSSPISGALIQINEGIINGKETKFLIIENDFKDKKKKILPSYNTLYNMTKIEISELIDKFHLEFNKDINLVINYNNSYYSDSLLFNDNIEEILELLDIFNVSFKKNITVYIKGNDDISSSALIKYANTYPNIKVIYDFKNLTDFCTVYDLYNVYLMLTSQKFLDYKYITIKTNKNVFEVKVKLYTRIDEVLKYLNIAYKSISLIYKDNTILFNKNDVIDKNILGIIVK